MLSMDEKQRRARDDQFAVTDRIRAWAREAPAHCRRADKAVAQVARHLSNGDRARAKRALGMAERAEALLAKAAGLAGERLGRAIAVPGPVATEALEHHKTILGAWRYVKGRAKGARQRMGITRSVQKAK